MLAPNPISRSGGREKKNFFQTFYCILYPELTILTNEYKVWPILNSSLWTHKSCPFYYSRSSIWCCMLFWDSLFLVDSKYLIRFLNVFLFLALWVPHASAIPLLLSRLVFVFAFAFHRDNTKGKTSKQSSTISGTLLTAVGPVL